MDWTPDSWTAKRRVQMPSYDDEGEVERTVAELAALPGLVTSWEIERLKQLLADAQEGRRFVLQGGDCAEMFSECRPIIIANKLKILLQMSLVLVHGSNAPVVRVARLAGQYAKPRSKPTERRNGQELPSYYGDLVNGAEFVAASRRPDPKRMLSAYAYASHTLNFVRALSASGFADAHHPEYWDLTFFRRARVPESLRNEYEQTARKLAEALRFMAALGEQTVAELTRVDFFMSHEGLNLFYEAALTHSVPRRIGHYLLSTHFPWLGERSRQLDGAHVEFFRGINNPIGIKIGPTADPSDIARLVDVLNPTNEAGKISLITRLGASSVEQKLPLILGALKASGARVLWMTDPMHGNTRAGAGGTKTRDFGEILAEIEHSFDVHQAHDSTLGGVHVELTGDDVTECVGGAAGITEEDLGDRYTSGCDPRLNYRQALELSFLIARKLRARRKDSIGPPIP